MPNDAVLITEGIAFCLPCAKLPLEDTAHTRVVCHTTLPSEVCTRSKGLFFWHPEQSMWKIIKKWNKDRHRHLAPAPGEWNPYDAE